MTDVIQIRNQLAADVIGDLVEKAQGIARPDVQCMLLVLADRLFDPQLDASGLTQICSAPKGIATDFRRLVGSSPRQLIAESRVRVARRLLDHTPWTINVIADLLGFSSAGALWRCFRRIDGRAPLVYRLGGAGKNRLVTDEPSPWPPDSSARQVHAVDGGRSVTVSASS